MSDAAETYAKVLNSLSGSASVLLQQRDNLIDQASNEGLLEAVTTHLSAGTRNGASSVPQIPNQSATGPASSSSASVALAGSKRRSDGQTDQSRPLTDRRRQVGTNPKVVIPRATRTSRPLRRVGMCPKAISQLQSRAGTECWETETESDPPHTDTVVEDSSEDELLHDTPNPANTAKTANPTKPAKPAKPAKLSKSKRPVKPARRVPRARTAPRARLEHIDWVFWIQADEVGYWLPFSSFPCTTQVLFQHKFTNDYLQKPYHIDYYACMLRNRDKRVAKQICVNNATYEHRNKPSRWKKTGDKELTCDLCFKKRRFCARLVKEGGVVKLGFYPLPESDRHDTMWKELHFWVRQEEKKDV